MHNKYKGRNKVSENKGITLIALIVTIIVLLILAGVTLNMILDENGLINKAQSAVKTQNVAAIKEALELEKTELYLEKGSLNIDDFIEQITTGNKSFTVDSIDKISDTELEIVINGDNKFTIKDNGKGDLDIAYKGVAQVGDLTLSATSGIYTYPTSGTFTVTNNKSGGALSVTSESPDVATAIISGNTVTVTPGTTAGKAKIVVKSAAVGEYAENRAIYMATVQNGTINISATPYTGTYDGAEHDALTNVKTTPTGTTIEYSTDGVNYSSTMPKVQGGGTFIVSVSASKAGYKTKTETYTVTVNKAAGGLSLSATSGTVFLGTPGSFTVTGNTSGGTISATSSNTSIATVSVSGNTITVSPKAVGTATITVKSAATSNYNEKTATYAVTVKSYVGKYVDIDDDGTVDGVIYADLAIGGSGQWYNADGAYTIPQVTSGLKNYYVSQSSYTDALNGTQKVIATKSTTGAKRFYVMALKDIDGKQNGTYYDWYNAAYGNMSDYTSATSVDFGKGSSNTATMISKWNAKAYGAQNTDAGSKDVWGQIQSQVNKGWFVPSRGEWAAFASNLSINSSNYSSKGLSNYCWSSSQSGTYTAWNASFGNGYMDRRNVNDYGYVRLGTTF